MSSLEKVSFKRERPLYTKSLFSECSFYFKPYSRVDDVIWVDHVLIIHPFLVLGHQPGQFSVPIAVPVLCFLLPLLFLFLLFLLLGFGFLFGDLLQRPAILVGVDLVYGVKEEIQCLG